MRAVLAVVLGYVAIFVFVFATFSAAYALMGADGAFEPASYEPSTLWLGTSFVLGLLGAVAGGLVAAAIGRGSGPVVALAALVLVLGLVFAGLGALAPADDRPTVRSGDTGNFEAMQNARQPLWVALLNPFVGAAGVWLGGRLRRSA